MAAASRLPTDLELAQAVCSQDLGAYIGAMWPRFRLARHHRRLLDALERVERGEADRIVVTMPPRHGKQCADDTPVPTPRGWVRHGDLRAGDLVFGPDGRPARVMAVSEPSLSTLRVLFTSGEAIAVHPAHEWTVFDRSRGRWRTVETRYLADQRWWSGGRARFELPEVSAWQTPAVVLPLDPYVLGVWLGDGTTGRGCITLGSGKRAVLDAVTAVLGEPVRSHALPSNDAWQFWWNGVLSVRLEAAGVLRSKAVPECYLRAGTEQRRALLAGLLDSDGHIDGAGRVRFVTCSEALRDGVVDLATGLGLRPYVLSQEPAVSSSGIEGRQTVWTVGFQSDGSLPTVRLTRCVGGARRRVGIQAIEPCVPVTGRCIQVDRADGLYLVGRRPVPTHNSLIVSQHFPAWFLGRNPAREVICATYAQEKADDWGREVRNQFADPLFGAIFPGVSLRADSKAARRFKTPQGGSFFAAGRNASITGRGAGVFVVDDPLKGREEADSPTIREKLKAWYSSVVYTRLDPGGAIVLVATRWHDDDLIGWVLREHAHEKWEVIDFPAISDRGEALWPERFPLDWLERRRRTLSERDWSALYQQRPQADEGGILKRGWWKPWTEPLPARPMMVVISLDTAYTAAEENDRSACTVWWLVADERDGRQALLLRYAWAKRLEFADLVQEVLDTARHFGVKGCGLRLLVEAKASGLSVVQELRRRAPDLSVWAVQPEGDKVARAYAAQPAFEAGKVFAMARVETVGDERVREPVFRPWAREVIDECAAFPRGTLADLVDSTTQAVGHLRKVGVTFFPEDDPPPPAVDARGMPRGGQGTGRRGIYAPVGGS